MFSPAWAARGLYHSECLLTLKPLFFTTVYLGFIFCYFCCRAPVKQSLLCEVAEFWLKNRRCLSNGMAKSGCCIALPESGNDEERRRDTLVL
jgi:hypothetical protein